MAIKIIHKNRIENKQDLARVRREIEFMSRLNHPHIVKILEGNDKLKRLEIKQQSSIRLEFISSKIKKKIKKLF